jgi:hypothetical protein
MSCNCGNSSCSKCKITVISKRGEQGIQGIQGLRGNFGANNLVYLRTPGTPEGAFSLNGATMTAITTFTVSKTSMLGYTGVVATTDNAQDWLLGIVAGDRIQATSIDDSSVFGIYDVVSIVENVSSFNITVSNIVGSGSVSPLGTDAPFTIGYIKKGVDFENTTLRYRANMNQNDSLAPTANPLITDDFTSPIWTRNSAGLYNLTETVAGEFGEISGRWYLSINNTDLDENVEIKVFHGGDNIGISTKLNGVPTDNLLNSCSLLFEVYP